MKRIGGVTYVIKGETVDHKGWTLPRSSVFCWEREMRNGRKSKDVACEFMELQEIAEKLLC